MKQDNDPYITIHLPQKEKDFIRTIAKRLGLSMSSFARLSLLKKAREEELLLKNGGNVV